MKRHPILEVEHAIEHKRHDRERQQHCDDRGRTTTHGLEGGSDGTVER